ncbi:MAG: hypothetical protein H8E42_00390 [Nitrospinae bacterium]|nr:hypothetical protein [Nitrospinota bacterium]
MPNFRLTAADGNDLGVFPGSTIENAILAYVMKESGGHIDSLDDDAAIFGEDLRETITSEIVT